MHRAFDALKGLIADRYDYLPVCRVSTDESLPAGRCDEDRMFRRAMADVKPLSKSRCVEPVTRRGRFKSKLCSDWHDVTDALQRLIDTGEGFVVASTPEYMEGTGPEVPPSLSHRLHRGDFAIQAYIDLHGLTVCEAQPAFDGFLKEAIATAKRTVLVIHGRGLSSRSGPVLKTYVRNWLSRSAWRRWVLAFASARSCDGGAGATIVLLREQPLKRRHRKEGNESEA